MKNIITAFIYARVSKDKHGNSYILPRGDTTNSLRTQINRCTDCCINNKFNISSIKFEIHKGDSIKDREILNNLIDEALNIKHSVLVVSRFDRLTRSIEDAKLLYNEYFKYHLLITADGKFNMNNKQTKHDFIKAAEIAFDENELRTNRINETFIDKKINNEKLGGYDEYGKISHNGKYIPHKLEQKNIQKMIDLHLKGCSPNTIAKEFNRRKIKTRCNSKHTKKFHPNWYNPDSSWDGETIKRILIRELGDLNTN